MRGQLELGVASTGYLVGEPKSHVNRIEYKYPVTWIVCRCISRDPGLPRPVRYSSPNASSCLLSLLSLFSLSSLLLPVKTPRHQSNPIMPQLQNHTVRETDYSAFPNSDPLVTAWFGLYIVKGTSLAAGTR